MKKKLRKDENAMKILADLEKVGVIKYGSMAASVGFVKGYNIGFDMGRDVGLLQGSKIVEMIKQTNWEKQFGGNKNNGNDGIPPKPNVGGGDENAI